MTLKNAPYVHSATNICSLGVVTYVIWLTNICSLKVPFKPNEQNDACIIIGPIADRGLALEFKKVKHRKATFAEIAPLIHYNKYNSYQVAFCTDKALQLLTYLDK